jgi:UDP-2,3-diacylglucosamine pyrophosphatase LpxH
MDNGPLIVVSDTHLGLEDSEKDRSATVFQHFLEWIAELERGKKVSIQTSNGEKSLQAPQKIILLGDLFELWEPQSGNLTLPFKDSFTLFNSLLTLKCEKVYVLGNHDEELSDYEGEYRCENGSTFTVFSRHYPKDPTREWEEVGDKKYFFLHGHQFDKLFECAGPLRSLPGLMEWLSSSASERINHRIGPIGFVLIFCFSALWITWSSWILDRVLIFAVFLIFWFIFIVLGISWFWTWIQKSAWTYVFKRFADRPKYADINKIINQNYYKKEKDTSVANVIVFGHTHVPEISSPDVEKKFGKMFVNSGSWVASVDPAYLTATTTPPAHDTLVYIDSEGPLLLQWDDEKGTVHQLAQYAKPEGVKKKWLQLKATGNSSQTSCEGCKEPLVAQAPFCMFCGTRGEKAFDEAVRVLLKTTLKLVITLLIIIVVNVTIIFYLLTISEPIPTSIVVIFFSILVSMLIVERLEQKSNMFRFWIAFFHRYNALRRALFLFGFYIFSFAFLLIALPTLQPVVPTTMQSYINSLVVSALAFTFAIAVWLDLSTTCRAWVLIDPQPVSNNTTKTPKRSDSAINVYRLVLYSSVTFIFIFGFWWVTDALRKGDTTLASTNVMIIIALFIGWYFVWHFWNSFSKILGSTWHTPYAQEIFKDAWFVIPEKIQAGGSSTIQAQIKPLNQKEMRNIDEFLEVEVQSAGLKYGSDQKQRKPIDKVESKRTLYYSWNCQFPDVGNHTIDIYCRIVNIFGIKQETFYTHRVKVTSAKSTFLLALLPVVYGAINVIVAVRQMGMI